MEQSRNLTSFLGGISVPLARHKGREGSGDTPQKTLTQLHTEDTFQCNGKLGKRKSEFRKYPVSLLKLTPLVHPSA
tara:strand:- start:125 stop:352 length:228 start_codon:yes stop_codon:yes gene_type:complete